MSSHPIENRKVLLVNEEERVRKGVSDRKERVGRQRESQRQKGSNMERREGAEMGEEADIGMDI